MILSEKWKFIYIKGYKVASTSIEIALSTIVGSKDIVTPITAIDEFERIKRGGRSQNYATSPALEEQYIRAVKTTPPESFSRLRTPRERYFNHMPLRTVLMEYGPAPDFLILCAERSPYSKILSWANMTGSYYR